MKTGTSKPHDVPKTGGGQARLDANNRVPLYHQIFLILRNRIYGGDAGAGRHRSPASRSSCHEFGVSRITAKRALNELADAGLVIRERGRGTRVVKRPPPPAVTSSIEGWLENISLMGMATEARVLDFGYVPASEDIAGALGSGTGHGGTARGARAPARRRADVLSRDLCAERHRPAASIART